MKHTRLVLIAVCVLVVAFSGGAATYAQMSDTETAEVSIVGPTPTPTPTEPPTTPVPGQPAISFVAFCVVDDTSASASVVTITDVLYTGEGEPFAIIYESTVELSTVVIKGGQEFENFDGGTSGTLVFGTGATPESAGNGPPWKYEQSSSRPCPDGETQVVKFEYDDGSGAFVAESETMEAGSFGVQSVETPSSETEKTNDSNVTPTATPAATTVETPSTPTETVTETAETETPTATPTPTETETPVDVSHPLETLSSGNETTVSETTSATPTTDDEEGQ